jgi:predicted MPP superfamily phosphohydrolase
MLRFYLAAGVYHLVLAGATVALLLRWRGRLAKERPAWLWLLFLAADATLFGLAVLVPAVLIGAFAPSPFFSIARFVCQGVFGEGALLLLGLAVLHGRAGLRRRAVLPLALLAVLLAAYWEAYHHGPYDLRVRRYAVDLRQGPATAGRFTLLHLSDVQTHAIRGYEERALERAKALRPDMIVITGDYVQPRPGTSYAQAFSDFNALMRRLDLRPPLGAFAVAGDTERAEWRGLFAGTRFRCLENETATVSLPGGRTLQLTGLALRESRGRSGNLASVVPEAGEGEVRIVAGHSPDFVRVLPEGVHLALAGHTHGGQVVLPLLGPPVTLSRLPNRYAGGLHRYEGTWLHVSRGIGMERLTAPQVRFLCPPEMTLLEVAY